MRARKDLPSTAAPLTCRKQQMIRRAIDRGARLVVVMHELAVDDARGDELGHVSEVSKVPRSCSPDGDTQGIVHRYAAKGPDKVNVR
jgi:hypothetical protein